MEGGCRLLNESVWKQVLLETGVELETRGIGQTTAVVVATNGWAAVGASIGDSGAWLIRPTDLIDLSARQPTKPLLGDRLVEPATFALEMRSGDNLLLATDGVLKYANADTICATVRRPGLTADETCSAIVRLPRLPNGTLQDDVGLVLFRCSIEARVATSLRRWREALSASVDTDPLAAAERQFSNALETWVLGLVPERNEFRGRWSDGLELDAHRFGEGDRIEVCGRIWRIDTQTQYPFEARLSPDRDYLASFDILFGDASAPGGQPRDSARHIIQLGTARKWMFRFSRPLSP